MNLKKGMYNVIFGVIGQVLTIIFAIIVPKVVIEGYGSEINGLLSSINQLFVYLALFEAGVGTASLQALYKPVALEEKNGINEVLAATHKYYMRTSLMYFIALMLFSGIYPLIIKSEINNLLSALLIIFGGLGNVINFIFQGKYKILLQAEGKSYIVTNITTIISIGNNVAKIILITNGVSVLTVQIVFFIFNILQMALFEFYIYKKYPWINLNVTPNEKAISQKNSVLVHQISSLIFSNTAIFILSVFQGMKVVSLYSLYNYIYANVLNMFNIVNNGLVFYLGQTYHADKKKFKQLYFLYELDIVVIGYYLFTVIGVLTLPFMKLYTANMYDYNYMNSYLPILFVAIQFLSISRYAANNLVNIAGHFKVTQYRAVLESTINIVVSLVSVHKVGIYGVLLGTLAALFYRTNDFILYANHKILHGSAKGSYRIWISNLLLAIFCFIVFYQPEVYCKSYFGLIQKGIFDGLTIGGIFIIGNFLLNWRRMKQNIVYIKERLFSYLVI